MVKMRTLSAALSVQFVLDTYYDTVYQVTYKSIILIAQ